MSANSIVLIIDDEPAAREGLEALLAGEDYQLELAVHGPDGLAKAAQAAPDVILLGGGFRRAGVLVRAADGYLILDEKDHLLSATSRPCLYLGLPLDGFTTAGKFVDVVRRQYRLA